MFSSSAAATFLVLGVISSAAWAVFRWRKAQHAALDPAVSRLYRDITPLRLDWKSKEQIQNAPLKGTYHLTMALQTCSFDEMIDMDKTYMDKVMLRRQILKSETRTATQANPVASNAVHELYEWMFGVYLPQRYPTMFSRLDEKGVLHNIALNEYIPLTPPLDPVECLTILGSHVDTDFLLLLPVADPKARPTRALPTPNPAFPYHLHAYVVCFPSGFDMKQKFGLPLAAIHRPVPGYAQKLEKSMDRFFTTLPFGKVVKRANWAIQQGPALFKPSGNHLATTLKPETMAPPKHEPTEQELKEWAEDAEKVVPEECMLRSERQTLHRLERSGALVFAFKTYLYPLPEVKAAGLGEDLADSAEGLWKGSVPAMAVYKRGVVWARKVVEYLRAP
ncbi:uncharacterized protein PV09_01057 [Verruconis gallopava]|uniref:Uncharacterized protein n=1 Tax=Verruconis gallopava TaxID=253628 RepID=A0A0D1Z568_9PEZI|nr:uncharacterized protein PV09_01057 [Verruconis gallopava]KIW08122.1 hypothetical protein PV09_01057 [Verruconis gallopava]